MRYRVVRELPHLSLPKVTILNGRLLRPVPPGSGQDKDSRWINVHKDALEEGRMRATQLAWVRHTLKFAFSSAT